MRDYKYVKVYSTVGPIYRLNRKRQSIGLWISLDCEGAFLTLWCKPPQVSASLRLFVPHCDETKWIWQEAIGLDKHKKTGCMGEVEQTEKIEERKSDRLCGEGIQGEKREGIWIPLTHFFYDSLIEPGWTAATVRSHSALPVNLCNFTLSKFSEINWLCYNNLWQQSRLKAIV